MKRSLATWCLAGGVAAAALAAQAQTPKNPPYSTTGGAAAEPTVPMVYSSSCGCFVPADATNPLQVSASVSASIAAFAPGATVSLSVTTSSARVAFGDGNPTALIENSGSSDAFINFGNGTVTATTAMTRVPAGAVVGLNVGSNADIAAITASGTTTLTITTGTGVPVVGLSGSGGSSANASVGTTGAAVPGSATYLGGVNAGNLIGVAVDSSGRPMSVGAAPSGASVAGNPLLNGGRAQSAEPSAVANGQAVAAGYSLAGKAITLPYANPENMLRGANSATGTSATTFTGMGAQGSGVKIYVTGVQCSNAGGSGSLVTLNDSAGSTLYLPAGGGNNQSYATPLSVAANTAFQFTPGTAETTINCNAQGFGGAE